MNQETNQELLGKDIRKLIEVGKSLAVTIPKEYIDAHGLKKGDKMEVSFNEILHIEPLNFEEIKKVVQKGENENAKSQG